MASLYLDQQGARLGREGHRLVLHDREGGTRYFPLEQVDRVMVYGQVHITVEALGTLLDSGIPTTLLTSRGRLRGHLLANHGGQVKRRVRQYQLTHDSSQAMPLAKILVKTKIRNQRWLLRTLGAKQPAKQLNSYLHVVGQSANADVLRGLEGNAARIYFAAFPDLLAGTPFGFPGRRRRPPTDPINSLLSLGYTLLLAELRNALHGYGLDPFAGVFHASDGGQPSCPLDLMEPLRCLVDRLVIRLAKQVYTPDDFHIDEKGACLLQDGRRGSFYKAWDEFLAERLLWRGEQHSYRAIIHAQIGELVHHLDNPSHVFRPLVLSALGR